MACEYCGTTAAPSYELSTTVAGDGARIDFKFCSTECLDAWV